MTYDVISLPYHANLRDHYQQLSHLDGFILLDSGNHPEGQYDILTACPYDELILYPSDSRDLDVFQWLVSLIPKADYGLDLPFQGGAIGYLSYDLANQLAGIKNTPLPTLMDMPLLHFGLYDWAIITCHVKKTVTLFVANTQPDTRILIPEIMALWRSPLSSNKTFHVGAFEASINKERYDAGIDAIQEGLSAGRCYQANYTLPFCSSYSGDIAAMYQKIRCQNPNPYSAFMRFKEADILSFSPERFLTIEDKHILASPIKGTAPLSARDDLKYSDKNRAENIMIVDLWRHDLSKIAKRASVQVTGLCELHHYPAVNHLMSHIEAIARDDLNLGDILKACFPSGSITGAPKLESMKMIAEQEPYSRGIYCGALMMISAHGRVDSSIAIRTIVAREGILHLGVGGGIVIDSTRDSEYDECLLKMQGIQDALK
jgi:para-aminobenzoate synthetase component 1